MTNTVFYTFKYAGVKLFEEVNYYNQLGHWDGINWNRYIYAKPYCRLCYEDMKNGGTLSPLPLQEFHMEVICDKDELAKLLKLYGRPCFECAEPICKIQKIREEDLAIQDKWR